MNQKTGTNLNQEDVVHIKHPELGLEAQLSLSEGGRLCFFNFQGRKIIAEHESFPYADSYAAAILFPFVSRTEAGFYQFKGENFQLACNAPDGKNALHGLVYNKTFRLVSKTESPNSVEVILKYEEKQRTHGFPYLYEIQLGYTFSKGGLTLSVEIVNKDNKEFPFTIGWHPYFSMPNPTKSSLEFQSQKTVAYDENLITKEIVEVEIPSPISLNEKSFDDCFILDDNKTKFTTEDYELILKTNSVESFLQIYTPSNLPLIAIEPMVGLSNSLNNQIGLQVLQPNQEFQISWELQIDVR